MTVELLAPAAIRRRPAFSFARWLEREGVFSWLMVAPPIAFLMALVGYPFFYGIWISLQNRPVAQPGVFVGFANFVADWHDSVFRQVVANTFVYTFAATVLKMVGGLGLALVMNQDFRFKNLTRALLLLPFIVPTVLSTIAWQWILDPAFSVINWALKAADLADPGPAVGAFGHEVSQPPVVRSNPGEPPWIVVRGRRWREQDEAGEKRRDRIREDDLGHDPVGLHVAPAAFRVPVAHAIARVPKVAEGVLVLPAPGVKVFDVRRVQVLPVLGMAATGVAVRGDDRVAVLTAHPRFPPRSPTT